VKDLPFFRTRQYFGAEVSTDATTQTTARFRHLVANVQKPGIQRGFQVCGLNPKLAASTEDIRVEDARIAENLTKYM